MKDNRAERTPHTVYKLNGVKYVPHYRNRQVFVGPGYPRLTQKVYSAAELAEAGAKEDTDFLWHRGEHGLVNATNL